MFNVRIYAENLLKCVCKWYSNTYVTKQISKRIKYYSNVIVLLLMISGAYEPPKEHETQFHDYPNYVMIFENSVYVIRGFR